MELTHIAGETSATPASAAASKLAPAADAGATPGAGGDAEAAGEAGASNDASAAADAAGAATGDAAGRLRFTVHAVEYEVEHVVSAAELRPPHVWDRASSSWQLRPPPEVHVVPRGAGGSGKSAAKRARRDSDSAPATRQVGEPTLPANQFALGTRRKGVDGAMWECDRRKGGLAWVAVPAGGGGASSSRRKQR